MDIKILTQNDLAFSETTGISYNIYFTGCSIRCPHCHNPELWDEDVGVSTSVNDVVNNVKKHLELIDAVCVLGGEPTDQLEGLLSLLKELQWMNISIWVYTGLDFEDAKIRKIYNLCDYIKCGSYEHSMINKDSSESNESNACNDSNEYKDSITGLKLASSNQYFKRGGRIHAD
ncbi:MAG: 4Fe-4S cluster-binding domain-containing protein [Desulfitobacteriaceae bacterium]|nr:4Fe-4S cluster-binding domain-containing protein [Desulfitobacteriaceae bacterium]